jgi:cytochrome c oxidase cbb3-type subunit 3
MKIHEIIIPMMLNVMMILILAVAPVPADAADAAAGAKINAKHCAKCHGETGKGDGVMLQKFKTIGVVVPDPVAWNDGAGMSEWTDEQLVKIIKQGGNAVGKSKIMPPWGNRLSDAEIADLVAHIRSLAK